MAQEGIIHTRTGAFGDIIFSRDFEDLSVRQVEDILKSDPEAYLKFKSARSSTAVGWLMYVGGTALFIATYDQLYTYGWVEDTSPIVPIMGLVTGLTGTALVLIARNNKVKAVNR